MTKQTPEVLVALSPQATSDLNSQFGQRQIHHSGRINGFESSLAHFPDSSLTIAVLSNLETGAAFRIAEDLATTLIK